MTEAVTPQYQMLHESQGWLRNSTTNNLLSNFLSFLFNKCESDKLNRAWNLLVLAYKKVKRQISVHGSVHLGSYLFGHPQVQLIKERRLDHCCSEPEAVEVLIQLSKKPPLISQFVCFLGLSENLIYSDAFYTSIETDWTAVKWFSTCVCFVIMLSCICVLIQ